MTTVLAVRTNHSTSIGGDGQVTLDDQVMKHEAAKIRRLQDGDVLVGFAGGTADAIELLERFEKMLSKYSGNVERASIELAREWRTDKALRRLESLMVVLDRDQVLLVSGSGDVISPDQGIVAVGSGMGVAKAAAKALIQNTDLESEEIVEKALTIASEIDIYTNQNFDIETLPITDET